MDDSSNIIEEAAKPHYACIGGCGRVSDTMIKCSSIGCWRARNPLTECSCTDGKHTQIFEGLDPEYKPKAPPTE